MKASNLIREDLICLNLKAEKKQEAIEEMVDLLVKGGEIANRGRFLKAILDRENLWSTGIGNTIAIIHAQTESARKVMAALARSEKGIDFKSSDGKPVHLLFMIATPKKSVNLYMKVLLGISRLLRRKSFRDELRKAKSPKEVIEAIKVSEK